MPPRFTPPPLQRIPPRIESKYLKTYSWLRPLNTHWRPATCEEVQCEDFVNGFKLTIDVSTKLGQRQYDFITHDRERSYTIEREGVYLYHFIYGPGNRGFAGDKHDHRLPIEREPLLFVRAGDWRQYLGEPFQHKYVDDWVEDIAQNQDAIIAIQKRG